MKFYSVSQVSSIGKYVIYMHFQFVLCDVNHKIEQLQIYIFGYLAADNLDLKLRIMKLIIATVSDIESDMMEHDQTASKRKGSL